jgi:hypothetical protein
MKNHVSGNLTSDQVPDAVSTVLGVVYPPGGSGGRFAEQADWTFRFTLQPWRMESEALQETTLSLAQNVPEDDLKHLMDLLQPYRIIQAVVRFTQPGHGEIVRLLNTAARDRDLERYVAEPQVSVIRVDPLFGSLTFNRSLAWWETTVSWAQQSVALYLAAENVADLDIALAVARSLWNDQAGWERRVREYAVQELLDLKNDSWLDDDEQPISSQQFLTRMTLESITVSPDGTFSFTHDDGNLFWGHAIQVSGNLQAGPTDADIPG